MIPVTDAYPALLRLTLRCLTCHGGVGVLLGCIFSFFPLLFSLLVECSFRAAIYSISRAFFFFFFSFFPPFLFFCSFGCVQSGLLDYIG